MKPRAATHSPTLLKTKAICFIATVKLSKCLLLWLVQHQLCFLCQAFTMSCVFKAMPIQFINGKYHIKKCKSCSRAGSFKGTHKHTHTHTHMHTHIHTHTHAHTHAHTHKHRHATISVALWNSVWWLIKTHSSVAAAKKTKKTCGTQVRYLLLLLSC